jgi:hypothetical protein
MKVFLLILFLKGGEIVGYAPGGAGPTVVACHQVTPLAIEAAKGAAPEGSIPLPLCLDVGEIAKKVQPEGGSNL